MLTPKQHQLLTFIQKRTAATGVSPSFDEMKEALDLRSKSGIHRLITALEERGFIRRLPHKARAIEVIRPLDNVPTPPAGPRPGGRAPGFRPSVISGAKDTAPEPRNAAPLREQADTGVNLPVRGRIAAGVPKEAIEMDTDFVGVPTSMVGTGDHYALEVRGDSMVNAGILDGDVVVIQSCDTARNGEIVVALIRDDEATLKRLRTRGGSIALEAENPDYETRIYRPDEVQIRGRLVGLIRQY